MMNQNERTPFYALSAINQALSELGNEATLSEVVVWLLGRYQKASPAEARILSHLFIARGILPAPTPAEGE